MGLFGFLFGNSKKKQEEEHQERLRNAARSAQEREKRLTESIRKEKEKLARLKEQEEKKRKEQNSLSPFVFSSNQHQRFENGVPVYGEQNCRRTVSVELNTEGCRGYQLQPGDGYIVKIYNDDQLKPLMADKPMRIYHKSDTTIELRGFSIKAQTPFGWQEIDLSDYSLIVYYENGVVSMCTLHMLDRNVFIEYRKVSTEDISIKTSSDSICEAEQYATQARKAAQSGNTSLAHRNAVEALKSLIASPIQVTKIQNTEAFALALGKMMEGNYFSDDNLKAVAISYYYLTKAIKECSNKNPFLYVYRFSIAYEYNKVFYHLFARSVGQQFNYDPTDIMSNYSMMEYESHLVNMQICDMFTEPRIGRLDNALNNIFHKYMSHYSNVNSEAVKTNGNKYHNQLYSYLKEKIENLDFDF